MMVSSIRENLFKRVIKRPGLFADAFYNTHCSSTDISEKIATEASIINKKLIINSNKDIFIICYFIQNYV